MNKCRQRSVVCCLNRPGRKEDRFKQALVSHNACRSNSSCAGFTTLIRINAFYKRLHVIGVGLNGTLCLLPLQFPPHRLPLSEPGSHYDAGQVQRLTAHSSFDSCVLRLCSRSKTNLVFFFCSSYRSLSFPNDLEASRHVQNKLIELRHWPCCCSCATHGFPLVRTDISMPLK